MGINRDNSPNAAVLTSLTRRPVWSMWRASIRAASSPSTLYGRRISASDGWFMNPFANISIRVSSTRLRCSSNCLSRGLLAMNSVNHEQSCTIRSTATWPKRPRLSVSDILAYYRPTPCVRVSRNAPLLIFK